LRNKLLGALILLFIISVLPVMAEDNASTLCSGTNTYLDGEGNCDTLDGLEDFETPTNKKILVGDGTDWATSILPDCSDSTRDKLNFDASSRTFSCNRDVKTVNNSLEGGTLTDTNFCVYDLAGTEIDCNIASISDTHMTSETFGDFTCTGLEDGCTLNANTVSTNELDESGVKDALEAVMQLQDMQGAVTDSQVPDSITITDNATVTGTQTLTNKTINGANNDIRVRVHATDCTGLTDGKDGEICYEQDADALYVCEPTAGDCDTAAEWRSVGGGGGLSDIVDDTTPQLGGNLDVNGNEIVSISNGIIIINPHGTGTFRLPDLTNCDTIDTDADGDLSCGTDASGSGGTANILDLADDDTNESTDLIEIAITGDTNGIVSEPTADKMLINMSNDWPKSDQADALAANGANCSAGNYPLGVDASGAVESCTADDDTPDAGDFGAATDLDSNGKLSRKFSWCYKAGDLTATDDDEGMGSKFEAVTITDVWCHYKGTGTTVAQVSLEDGSGNAMTHTTPTCTAHGTQPSSQSVTAGGSLVAREVLRFDVDNTPDPTTDDYEICVAYTF
jgi:hypothetical protein